MDTPEINVDIDDLTVGEIEEIEDMLDTSFDTLGKDGAKKGKFMRAIAWVSVRRTNPEFSWDDAGNIRVRDITNVEHPTSADEPTN